MNCILIMWMVSVVVVFAGTVYLINKCTEHTDAIVMAFIVLMFLLVVPFMVSVPWLVKTFS